MSSKHRPRARLAGHGLLVLALSLSAMLAGMSPAAGPQSALAAPASVGTNSCIGIDACTGATGNIGNNSCTGDYACYSAAGNIGNDSCDGDWACAHAAGDIGDESCIGEDACYTAAGDIGDNSCTGEDALGACESAEGNIGDNSCNGDVACHPAEGNIGDNSCNGYYACASAIGDIGDNSCNVGAACTAATGNIGNNSCNGDAACYFSDGNIGNNSCNGASACYFALGEIGACQNNDVEPAACSATPDARIKRVGGPLRGDNIYNADAAGQTVNLRPRAGSMRVVRISMQNDRSTPDGFTLDVTGASPSGYTIRYYRGRTTEDITAAVVGGSFTTPVLAAGAKYVIRAHVTTTSAAAPASAFSRLFTISSIANPSMQDAVGLNVSRR